MLASAVVDLTGVRLPFEYKNPMPDLLCETGVTMWADSFAAFLRRRIDAPGNDGAPRYDMHCAGAIW